MSRSRAAISTPWTPRRTARRWPGRGARGGVAHRDGVGPGPAGGPGSVPRCARGAGASLRGAGPRSDRARAGPAQPGPPRLRRPASRGVSRTARFLRPLWTEVRGHLVGRLLTLAAGHGVELAYLGFVVGGGAAGGPDPGG